MRVYQSEGMLERYNGKVCCYLFVATSGPTKSNVWKHFDKPLGWHDNIELLSFLCPCSSSC